VLVSQASFLPFIDRMLTFSYSLEKEGARRATPWRMHEHPWMVEMRTKRVDMVQFLTTVWDWQD